MGNLREENLKVIKEIFAPKKNNIFILKKVTLKKSHKQQHGQVKRYTAEEIFLFKLKKYGKESRSEI